MNQQLVARPAAIIGILLISIAIVEVPKYLVVLFIPQGSALLCGLLCCQVVMAVCPFFLARAAPTVADFDRQWFPSHWTHWLWFPGLVLLLFVVYGLHDWLSSFREEWWLVAYARQVTVDVSPVNLVLRGVILILFAPVAEELYWRAFLLPQLGKLIRWPIALASLSLLFSLVHLPAYWSVLVACFFYSIVFGVWRIRFRSIIPLVLAHMLLNAVAFGPHLLTQFNTAVESYPKCREIDRLAKEPVTTAVPALIAMMADREAVVSLYALEVLDENCHSEAEPYFADVLASGDEYTVNRVLLAIESCGYSGLTPQVRAIAWSSDDVGLQLSAVLTLRGIGDEEGLADIMQRHPADRVRHAARDMLRIENGGWDERVR